jgi:predicted phosphodiesterase
MQNKKEIAAQYLRDYPDLNKSQIARRLCHDHPLLFPSVERARDVVRYATGTNCKSRKHCAVQDVAYVGSTSSKENWGIPKSYAKEWNPYELTEDRYMILSDVHLPYHSVMALEAAFEYGCKKGIKNIILNGDCLDFYQLSRFEKNPDYRRFSEELETWHEFIKVLQKNFGGQIVFKEGNHEERYGKFIAARAPELYGVNDFTLPQLLKLDSYNVEWVSEKRPMFFGDLTVLHGHEYSFGVFSPVNVARGLFLRAKTSSICGHHHQTSQHQERDLRGNEVITYSVGCLSELTPAYLPLNKFNHGFAIIERNGNDFEVDNQRIDANGRVHR